MITRRKFLRYSRNAALAAGFLNVVSCDRPHSIQGSILDGNANRGHRLREMNFPDPDATQKTGVVIVGGGVSGLSAARYLKKYTSDFLLLELGQTTGGNAESGCNNLSCYPWGAHYLPLPGNGDPELLAFLRESEVIVGERNGLPSFSEYHLCHDPKERLYINHFWQDGIIPHEGVPKNDRDEIQRFLALMEDFRNMRGSDQKKAFTLPLDNSSRDQELMKLDRITAEEFLTDHQFKSPYLRWYVNYCCADDYGTSVTQTSAWAMIHYFAAREGRGYRASSDAVLTWPEGNSWLTKRMAEKVKDNIRTDCVVYKVSVGNNQVACEYFDVAENKSVRILADAVIMATPQFVNNRILSTPVRNNADIGKFQYAPWMVANITTSHSLNERRGEQLAWDNVIYGSTSLGYVNAMHQHVGMPARNKIITYYKPLLAEDVASARRQAYSTNFETWTSQILTDLKIPHANIAEHIENIDVRLWGHGMIKPGRDFIWSGARLDASEPVADKIFFAHSDLSGISIFEEAFFRGHHTAKQVLAR